MTQTEEYPLPTVHMNGTSKEMLLEGNEGIIRAIHTLKEAIQNCEFHGRDYYVHPLEDTVIGGAYGLAADERQTQEGSSSSGETNELYAWAIYSGQQGLR